MKMNDTVARIVEIMFQDVEVNEETEAIREEVMNNCQERYTDLVGSGMADDDAIAAVIESLKGMEDVLAPYKKKDQYDHNDPELDDDLDEELDDGERHLIFAANEIHKIDLVLVNEDVTVEASDDADYHVLFNAEDNPLVQAFVKGGILKIERRSGDAVKMKKDGDMEYHHKDNRSDFVRTEKGRIEINMDSIDGMLKSIGNSLKNTFSNIHINIGFGDDSAITIQVPEEAIPHMKLLTTSGDIRINDVALTDLNVTSTSGDITIDLNEELPLQRAELRTTSGDITASVFTQEMTVSSTSGDAEIEGRINVLGVNTISGDIDVRADVKTVSFKAISGDVDLCFDSEVISDVCGSTISGDIDIELPDGIGAIAINTNTRSGDVTTRYHTDGCGPVVRGNVTSMSGDITIS